MLQMKNEMGSEPGMANTALLPIRNPIFALTFAINHARIYAFSAVFNLIKQREKNLNVIKNLCLPISSKDGHLHDFPQKI